ELLDVAFLMGVKPARWMRFCRLQDMNRLPMALGFAGRCAPMRSRRSSAEKVLPRFARYCMAYSAAGSQPWVAALWLMRSRSAAVLSVIGSPLVREDCWCDLLQLVADEACDLLKLGVGVRGGAAGDDLMPCAEVARHHNAGLGHVGEYGACRFTRLLAGQALSLERFYDLLVVPDRFLAPPFQGLRDVSYPVVPKILAGVCHPRIRPADCWRDDNVRLGLIHEALRHDTEGEVAVAGDFSKESAGHASQIKRGGGVLQNREMPLLKQRPSQVILIFPRLLVWATPGLVTAAASEDGQ